MPKRTPVKVKVDFEGDIRRWRFPPTDRFASLVDFVCAKFGFADRSEFVLQCVDDEDDRITIGTDSDFEESYESVVDEAKKTWKIYVLRRGDTFAADAAKEAERSESADFDLVDAESVVSVATSVEPEEKEEIEAEFASAAGAAAVACADEADAEQDDIYVDNDDETAPLAGEAEIEVEEAEAEMVAEVADVETDAAADEAGEKAESIKEKCCSEEFKTNALDYLMNEDVRRLLPEFVRAVVKALAAGGFGARATSSSVRDAWNSVIAQDRFLPLLAHPFYTDYATEMLPRLFEKAAHVVPMLTTFNEDMIVGFIPRAIDIAINALSAGFESFSCSTLLPQWMKFLNPEMMSGAAGSAAADDAEAPPSPPPPSDTHIGVACDGCGKAPIQGVRYKCTVCTDYDLCEACEEREDVHDKTHPMLKIPFVVRGTDAAEFDGLKEQAQRWGVGVRSPRRCGRFGRGRRHCGGRRHGGRRHGGCRRFSKPGCPDEHPMAGFFKHMAGSAGCEVRTDPVTGETSLIVDIDAPDMAKAAPGASASASAAAEPVAKKEAPSAKFLSDVNYADRDSVPCGVVITKTWRLLNDGPTAWPKGVKLCFMSGNFKCAHKREVAVRGKCEPGDAIDVSAKIKVPKRSGRFIVYFRLKDAEGEWFGPRVWCELIASDEESVKMAHKAGKLEAKKAKLESKIAKCDAKIEKVMEKASAMEAATVEPIAEEVAAPEPKCLCGGDFARGTPVSCYHFGARVYCDMCSNYVPTAAPIFHCGAAVHEGGYDICETCHSILAASMAVPVPARAAEPVPEMKDETDEDAVAEEASVEAIDEEEIEIIEEVVAEEEASDEDPLDGFKYADAAHAIISMGFDDIDTIKFLLTKHKGNSDAVVHVLLGLSG